MHTRQQTVCVVWCGVHVKGCQLVCQVVEAARRVWFMCLCVFSVQDFMYYEKKNNRNRRYGY